MKTARRECRRWSISAPPTNAVVGETAKQSAKLDPRNVLSR